MTIEETFNDLTARAETITKGIPWARLEAEGKVGNYVVDYIAPAFSAATDVMNTLYYDIVLYNKAQTESAVKQIAENMYDGIKNQLSDMLHGNISGFLKNGVALQVRNLRDLVSLAYGTAFFGARLHSSATDYAAIASLPYNDVKAHADKVVRILEGIKILDDLGVLTFMKWDSSFMEDLRIEQGYPPNTPNPPNPMKGLGAVPVLGIVIAIIAGIVIIAGIWIWARSASEYNRQALATLEKLCSDPSQSEKIKTQCVKALSEPQAGFAAVVQKLGTTALTYVFIGALIVGAIYLAPRIVRSFREAQAEARA
jgi:hypothetical protein